MEPDENNTISIEEFLCAVVGVVKGSQVNIYLKQSKKVGDAMPDDRVSFDDYLAFQYFCEQIDLLKSEVNQYRYLDFEMFTTYVSHFNEKNENCKKRKVKLSDSMTKAIFIFLDIDESGELEQEEITEVMQERQLFGQMREAKAKEDARQFLEVAYKKVRKVVKDHVGY